MTSGDSSAPRSIRRVAITGASGLLGSALSATLRRGGVTVHRMRRAARVAEPDIAYDPKKGDLDLSSIEGVDAVVNLAGAPIAERWTAARKAEIRDSRITTTAFLANAIARMRQPPRVLLSGSAIGYYGNGGDRTLDESSPPGSDFLAATVVAWEQAARPAEAKGVRVVFARSGLVLSRDGGALSKMLLPFRLGLGGRIGSGAQWMSWISLEDWVRAALFLLTADPMTGPVNLVAPTPVPNAEFTKTLAHVLGRPRLGFVPAAAIDLVFGEMGRSTILTSQRVYPKRLLEVGFDFVHPTLERALRATFAAA